MSIQVLCSKGCGQPINVTDAMISEASAAGRPLDVSHDVCPRDRKVQPKYRLEITVQRIVDTPSGPNGELAEGEHGSVEEGTDKPVYVTPLTRVGATREGASFIDVFEGLVNDINDKWQDVGKFAAIADAEG